MQVSFLIAAILALVSGVYAQVPDEADIFKRLSKKANLCGEIRVLKKTDSCRDFAKLKDGKTTSAYKLNQCKTYHKNQAIIDCTRAEVRRLSPVLATKWKEKYGPGFVKKVEEHELLRRAILGASGDSEDSESSWLRQIQ